MAKSLSEQTLVTFLSEKPGRSVTVDELAYAFGGLPQKHTAMLQMMVNKGILAKKGRSYSLTNAVRPVRFIEREKKATWDQHDQRAAARHQNRAALTDWGTFDQRTAREWPSEDARKEYLQDHLLADPKNHTVSEKAKKAPKDEAKGKVPGKDEEPGKAKGKPPEEDAKGKGEDKVDGEAVDDVDVAVDTQRKLPGFPVDLPKFLDDDRDATEEEIEEFRSSVPKNKLFKKYKLNIVAGSDKKTTVNDLLRAKHVAEAKIANIEKDATKPEGDLCKLRPNLCKGNKGILRSSMPQLMEKPIGQLLNHDKEDKRKLAKAYIAAAKAQGKSKEEIDELLKSNKSPKDMFIDSLIDEFGQTDDQVSVQDLKATQMDIKANKSYSMAESYLAGADSPYAPEDPETGEKIAWSPAEDEIIISKDGFILDGHHRWSSAMISDPDLVMKVKRIGLNMDELLDKSFEFPGTFRADINENIIDPNSPLDLAREKNTTWAQVNGKYYAKNSQGKNGGPFEDEKAAKRWMQSGASGKKPKEKAVDKEKKAMRVAVRAGLLQPDPWDTFDQRMASVRTAADPSADVLKFLADMEGAFRRHFPRGHFYGHASQQYGRNAIYISAATLPKGQQFNGIIQNDPSYNTFWMHDSYSIDGLNDKIKIEMSQGDRLWGPNASNPQKVGWRNGTQKPAAIIKKFEKYFGKLKSMVDARAKADLRSATPTTAADAWGKFDQHVASIAIGGGH